MMPNDDNNNVISPEEETVRRVVLLLGRHPLLWHRLELFLANWLEAYGEPLDVSTLQAATPLDFVMRLRAMGVARVQISLSGRVLVRQGPLAEGLSVEN